MTNEEARKVAGVISSADNECFVCAASQAQILANLLPEHDWLQLVATAGGWDRALLEDPYD